MGNIFGKPNRILMLGLDGSGKTTILYKLKFGRVVETVTTIGFNTEMIRHKGVKFTVFDFGGYHKIRWLWYRYCHHVKAIIFVLDTSDRERMFETKELFARLLETQELSLTCLLIYANRRNVPDAMTQEEITAELDLRKLLGRQWHLETVCAVDNRNDALLQGFNWLWSQVSKNRRSKRITGKKVI